MPRLLHSQRRAPRVPLRVWASLAHRGAEWRVETEDVGPSGCLVRSERLLIPGLDVRIVLHRSALSEELAAEGKVAWYDAMRGGISFDPRRSRPSSAWFRKLVAADRRLAQAATRSPTELGLDTRLFLPTPPRIIDLSPDEELVVGCADQGIPVSELSARSGLTDQRLGKIVFGLLSKRVFTLAAGEAGEAWKWRAALAVKSGPLVGSDGASGHPERAIQVALCEEAPTAHPGPWLQTPPAPPTAASAPSLRPIGAPRSSGAATSRSSSPGAPPRIPPASPPNPRAVTVTPTPTAIPAPAATPGPTGPSAPPAARAQYEPRYERSTGAAITRRILHGVGSGERSSAAESEVSRAREAEAAGRVSDAIRLLRRALAMAPQDREIAGELARLAFLQPAP